MAIYRMEIRNTQDWSDCRFRAYTTSRFKSEVFMEKVKKIQFTDSGHGLVPTVSDVKSRKRDTISILADHVRGCI